MPRSLDVLRSYAGEAGGPELVTAVRRLSSAAIDALSEALLAQPATPSRVVAADEVWPLVNARASTRPYGLDPATGTYVPPGLNLSAAIDPRRVGAGMFSDGVVRALLYSHGLVIEDPLMMAADMHQGSPEEVRAVSRVFIETAAVSMVEIEVLLDAGIVETFFVSSAEREKDVPLLTAMQDALSDMPGLDADRIRTALESSYIEGLDKSLQELFRQLLDRKDFSLDDLPEGSMVYDNEITRTFIKIVGELKPDSRRKHRRHRRFRTRRYPTSRRSP